MASIEDLLQSDDSDDEEDPNVDLDSVDLEQLLNAKEDDDDDDPYTALGKVPSRLPTSLPSKKEESKTISTSESLSISTPNIEDLLKSIKFGGRADSTASDQFDSSLLLEAEEEVASPNQLALSSESVDCIESLRAAEAREQRTLLTIEKAAPSALQVRRQVQSTENPAMLLHMENLPIISAQLKRNISYQLHGPGQGTACCICSKFLAIGTNKGYILIFDHNQEIRRVLNSTQLLPQLKNAFITAIHCLPDGSCLLSAHKTGDIVLWDAARGTILKHFRDPSNADLVSVEFLPSISFSDPKINGGIESEAFHVISRAENHIVNRHKVTKSLLSGWHVEIDCLLDNSKEAVTSLVVCPPGPALGKTPPTSVTNDIRWHPSPLQLVAFSLKSMTAVVQVVPEVKIVHKWNTSSSSSTSLEAAPLLEWGWLSFAAGDAGNAQEGSTTSSEESKDCPTPSLVRCAGGKIEALTVRPYTSFQPRAQTAAGVPGASESSRRSSLYRLTSMLSSAEEVMALPPFTYAVEAEYDCSSLGEHTFIYAVRYISPHHLVALTDKDALLFDARLQLLERIGLGPDLKHNIQPYIHTHIYGSPTLYPLSMASELYVDRIYMLLPGDVYTLSIRSPWDQVQLLVGAGKYIEGLAYIVDTVLKAPTLLSSQRDTLRGYIYNYALLAVKRPIHDAAAGHSAKVPSHLPLVASVCIEYCIHTNMLDILWHDLYDIFKSEGRGEVFLEALETYIYGRQLTSLPPYIVTEYIQLALSRNRYKTIEKSILYIDVCILDLNMIMRFLYTLRMYTSFLYVYSQGLGDFAGAAMQVFQQIRPIRGGPNVDQVVEDAEVGYRLLLFALYTFEDKIYPLGTAKPGDLATISALLDALVCERFVPPHPQLSGGTATSTGLTHDWSGISYPVLLYLTLLDAQATFHVLGKGLDKCYHLLHTPRRAALGSSTPAPSAPAITSEDGHQKLSRTIDVILAFAASTGSSSSSVSPPPSSPVPAPPASTPGTPAAWSGGLAHLEKLFFDRVYSVLRGLLGVHLSFSALATLVRYCGAKGWSQRRSGLEEDLRLYLDAQCRAREVRGVAAVYTALLQNKFYLAATSLRNLYLSPVGSPAGDSRHPPVDVRAALTHYLALPAIPLAFDFLALHLTGTSSRAAGDDEVQRGALIDKLAELARADLPRTVRLCAEHLLPHFAEVVEGLKHDTRALFNFLTAFIEDFHRNSNNASAAGVVDEDGNMGGNSGKDASLSPTFVMTASNSATDLSVRANAASAGSGGRESELFAQHWTSDLLLQYIRLLCTYNPEATLPFLRTYVRYVPVDGCLAIVREHQLYDCVAHLLERCGDAKGALDVLLKDSSARVRQARRDVDALLRQEATAPGTTSRSGGAQLSVKAVVSAVLSRGLSDLDALLRVVPPIQRVARLLDCAVGLCSRQLSRASTTTPSGSPAPSAPPSTTAEAQVFCEVAFDHLLQERRSLRAGTMSSAAELLAQVLSHFLKHLIAAMRHAVSPQTIVARLVQHASASGLKLAEFRDVFVHMLEAAAHEHAMARVVNEVLRADVFTQQRQRLGHMRSFVYKSDPDTAGVATEAVEGTSEDDPAAAAPSDEDLRAERERRARRLRGRPAVHLDPKAIRTRFQEKLFAQVPRTAPPHFGYVRTDGDDRSYAGRMNAVAIHARAVPPDHVWH